MVPILYVFGSVFVDFICCTKCRFSSWCRNECSKWCIFGTSYVRTIPSVLRILRIIRCNSNLFALDHISIVHQIWIRRHRIGHLLVWSWQIKMPSNLLSFPVTRHNSPRIGHGWRQLHTWYCCLSRYIHYFTCISVHIFELEIALIAVIQFCLWTNRIFCVFFFIIICFISFKRKSKRKTTYTVI